MKEEIKLIAFLAQRIRHIVKAVSSVACQLVRSFSLWSYCFGLKQGLRI